MTDDAKPLMKMAHAERADLADFLATLTPSEWQSPSLCYKWNVKDVVAHVVSYEHLTKLGLVKRFLKGGIVRTNEVGVAEFAPMSTTELLDFLYAHLEPRGLTAGFGGMIALVDGTEQCFETTLEFPEAPKGAGETDARSPILRREEARL